MSRLPVIDGVSPSRCRVLPGDWDDLLHFLRVRFPAVGAATWSDRLRAGQVLDGDGRAYRADQAVRPGDLVCYYRDVPDETVLHDAPLDIVYQDEHLLVVDKPPLVPVMPAGRFLRQSLLVRLRAQTGAADLVPLHRLDRDTAGLVMCSLRPDTRDAYTALFRERRIDKHYEVVARWQPGFEQTVTHRSLLVADTPFFRVREVPGPANSETRITLCQRAGALARYRAQPVTGRKHQIRVHFAALGMPILFDRCYPELLSRPDDPDRPLQLLARALRFTDPLCGEPRQFDSRRQLALDRLSADQG